ncbi:hypothetical protein G7085_16660 [Tessaracoccus sp. HDW20]|uniref:hypothetical protein n=1 Tax=Tessaracoccus coleopterorum TaxID=2714950 RepID=UPI0018D3CF4B|nr:hypothetical protein [Tessaracoccus coleopterorum]NHB85678.1 hypothetical protein [Tessaracoccus coleopterorum]
MGKLSDQPRAAAIAAVVGVLLVAGAVETVGRDSCWPPTARAPSPRSAPRRRCCRSPAPPSLPATAAAGRGSPPSSGRPVA